MPSGRGSKRKAEKAAEEASNKKGRDDVWVLWGREISSVAYPISYAEATKTKKVDSSGNFLPLAVNYTFGVVYVMVHALARLLAGGEVKQVSAKSWWTLTNLVTQELDRKKARSEDFKVTWNDTERTLPRAEMVTARKNAMTYLGVTDDIISKKIKEVVARMNISDQLVSPRDPAVSELGELGRFMVHGGNNPYTPYKYISYLSAAECLYTIMRLVNFHQRDAGGRSFEMKANNDRVIKMIASQLSNIKNRYPGISALVDSVLERAQAFERFKIEEVSNYVTAALHLYPPSLSCGFLIPKGLLPLMDLEGILFFSPYSFDCLAALGKGIGSFAVIDPVYGEVQRLACSCLPYALEGIEGVCFKVTGAFVDEKFSIYMSNSKTMTDIEKRTTDFIFQYAKKPMDGRSMVENEDSIAAMRNKYIMGSKSPELPSDKFRDIVKFFSTKRIVKDLTEELANIMAKPSWVDKLKDKPGEWWRIVPNLDEDTPLSYKKIKEGAVDILENVSVLKDDSGAGPLLTTVYDVNASFTDANDEIPAHVDENGDTTMGAGESSKAK